MKKLIKILPIIMTVLMIFMTVSPIFAGDVDWFTFTDKSNEVKGVTTAGNVILGIIRVIGTVIAIGVLMVLGIKYMMGSAEQRAEYKKTMLPYIIGAVILFAAVNLAGYLYDLAQGFGSTGKPK